MRTTFLLTTLFWCTFASGQGLPGIEYREPLPFYYDAATGNATVDLTNVFGGESAGYGFGYSAAVCESPCVPLRAENHTPFMGGAFTQSTAALVGESNFAGVSAGVYSLGDILPIGLTEQELVDTYFTPDPVRNWVQYSAIGPAGSGIQHAFQPIYSRSPFPAQNDSSVGPETGVEQWATEAELRYNELTGDVTLDSSGRNGGAMFSYELELTEPVFRTSEYRAVSGFGTTNGELDHIVEVDWNGIPAGEHSLGRILPTGLTPKELVGVIDSAKFLGELGHDVDSFDIDVNGHALAISHIVPEPNSVLMIVGAGPIVLSLSRRQIPSRRRGK